jgi:glucokinase
LLREDYLGEHLGLEVTLANDADAAVVGEAYFGGGRDHADVAYMTVSTGIGAGVVLGGRLMRGRRSSSEIGHTVVDRPALFAGAPATFEELASGTALAASAAAVGLPSDARRVVELVADGNSHARRIWQELVDVLVVGVTNLAHLYAPQVIVLGGGVGRNADLLAPIRRHLADRGPRSLPEPILVVTSELGDSAGLVGAAAWLTATGRGPQVGRSVPRMWHGTPAAGTSQRKDIA